MVKPVFSLFEKFKTAQIFVYVLIVLVGLGATWGVTSTTLNNVKSDVGDLQTQVNRLHEGVVNVEKNNIANEQTLRSIREDLREIKQDLKRMLKNAK